MSLIDESPAEHVDATTIFDALNIQRFLFDSTVVGLKVPALAQIAWGSGEEQSPAADVTLTFEQLAKIRAAADGLIKYGTANTFPWTTATEGITHIIEQNLLEAQQVQWDFDNNKKCVSCSTACTRNCQQVCYDNCSTACDSNCSSVCSKSTCTGGCQNSCSGCGNNCISSFLRTCAGVCSGGCDNGCTGSCSGRCISSCTGASCYASCTTNCAATCSTACASTCTDVCTATCSDTCTATCGNECTTGPRQGTDPGWMT